MFPSDCPQNRDKEIIVRVAGNYGKTFLSGGEALLMCLLMLADELIAVFLSS
jgi:hypothetical protein